MVVGFCLWIFVFWHLSSVRTDIAPSIRGIIHNTQVVLLDARVTVLEPHRGQISRHFWLAWWSDFWSIFGFSDFPGLVIYFAPPIRGIINHTQAMLLNVWVTVLGPTRGDISRHFWVAWWPGFGPAFRESTVSTAFARKPWLTVYRAHSGSSPTGGKTAQIMTKIIGSIGTTNSTIPLNLTDRSP